MSSPTGMVFDVKEFAVHDGPGIRTTVFLKGCPLRCPWCHNPEGLAAEPQRMQGAGGERLVGREMGADELAERLNSQADMLRDGEGGVTFSGGEPLLQAEFVAAVIDRLRDVHVLLDTSGYGSIADFVLLLNRVDQVSFDLKVMDPSAHRRFTGAAIDPILRNLGILAESGVATIIRVPLVPGITDTRENLAAIAQAAAAVKGLQTIELLPYNRAAGGKYAACGMVFRPTWDESLPVRTEVESFRQLGVPVRIP